MVKSASFCILLTHITSFDIFRNFIKETERWTIFGKGVPGRREKLRKNVARKSHGTGPTHHGRTTRDRHNWPGNQVARPGRATWHDRAMWHGGAVPCGTPVPLVRCSGDSFGRFLARSPRAYGHDRATPVPRRDLKALSGLFQGGEFFSSSFSFSFQKRF